MKAVLISALSSGQGKTLFTMALMHWLMNNYGLVRPFKVGPDYIDPRFHEKITGYESINLDLYLMSEKEVISSFSHYSNGMSCSVVEGVMGFYDGIDYGTSTYEIAKTLHIPVILLVSAEGTYSTLAAILKGILEYRPDNMIKGIILNKVSSQKHYETIFNQLKREIPQLKILGWIKKGLTAIQSRHLGLDLNELDNENLNTLSETVMENINTYELMQCMQYDSEIITLNDFKHSETATNELFKKLTTTVVRDNAFSFVYTQNMHYFERVFGKLHIISALNNDEIPSDTDIVYIPGGYVETPEIAMILDKADKFKQSLRRFAADKNKRIYAECAGLMFLGEKIQTTDDNWINGAGLLPMDFEIQKVRQRLGYYKAIDKDNFNIYKGHSFHYSRPVNIKDSAIVKLALFKDHDSKAIPGGWTNSQGNVFGTYLHSFFYNQPELILRHFIPNYENRIKVMA